MNYNCIELSGVAGEQAEAVALRVQLEVNEPCLYIYGTHTRTTRKNPKRTG